MGVDLRLRVARPDEFDTVLDLLGETVEWLRHQGLDQWSTWRRWRVKMRPALERGDVWILSDGDRPVGTITVESLGDPDFWTPEELAEPAAYVSKLAVRPGRRGSGLGALLLGWAGDLAHRRGWAWVRLDAWKTNQRLHAYYLSQGWRYLRTVDRPGRCSGALFQTPAQPLDTSMRDRIREIPSG